MRVEQESQIIPRLLTCVTEISFKLPNCWGFSKEEQKWVVFLNIEFSSFIQLFKKCDFKKKFLAKIFATFP
jgi:hypothetical protein